jgi:hypothetical protein
VGQRAKYSNIRNYCSLTRIFAFLCSLDLQTIQGLTYFGGRGHDSVRDMVLDYAGNILFSGIAGDGGVPITSDAEQKNAGDRFLARMSSDLTTLHYSTYIPIAGTITPGSGNNIYLSGSIDSSADLPVSAGAFNTSYNGGATDGYIVLYQITAGDGGDPDPGPDPTPGDNMAPTADAGPDQTVIHKTTVTLDGRGSSDSDGSVESYRWEQVEGRNVSLKDANSAVATFTAPKTRRGRTRTFVFELTFNDNEGASDTDLVTITVTR